MLKAQNEERRADFEVSFGYHRKTQKMILNRNHSISFQQKSKLHNQQLCDDILEKVQQHLIIETNKSEPIAIYSYSNHVFATAQQAAFLKVCVHHLIWNLL